MKKKNFQLEISEPCHEKWHEMSATECGAFCMHCQKEVKDFTQKTHTEIANYFANKKDGTCGRFYASQLEETYTHIEPQKYNNLKYAAGLAVGLLVAENNFAQENKKPETTITTQKNDSLDVNKSMNDSLSYSKSLIKLNKLCTAKSFQNTPSKDQILLGWSNSVPKTTKKDIGIKLKK